MLVTTEGAPAGLPVAAYTSPEVFDWEQRRLFEDGWVCVGQARDLETAGDQRAFQIGREGLLLVRGDDGVVRGFYNVCRHRGHELLEPGTSRNLRGIRCPYHAWVYRLDGALAAAPRFGETETFDKAVHPLIGARVGAWRGWILANLSGEAPDLSEAVHDLDDTLREWGPDRLVAGATRTHEVAANWKTISESHLARGWHDPASGAEVTQERPAQDVLLFPNLLLSLRPDHVVAHRLEPLSPGLTSVESRWLFPPEALERGSSNPSTISGVDEVAQREDFLTCESIHRQLTFAGIGRRPSSWSQDRVRAYVSRVAQRYLE